MKDKFFFYFEKISSLYNATNIEIMCIISVYVALLICTHGITPTLFFSLLPDNPSLTT